MGHSLIYLDRHTDWDNSSVGARFLNHLARRLVWSRETYFRRSIVINLCVDVIFSPPAGQIPQFLRIHAASATQSIPSSTVIYSWSTFIHRMTDCESFSNLIYTSVFTNNHTIGYNGDKRCVASAANLTPTSRADRCTRNNSILRRLAWDTRRTKRLRPNSPYDNCLIYGRFVTSHMTYRDVWGPPWCPYRWRHTHAGALEAGTIGWARCSLMAVLWSIELLWSREWTKLLLLLRAFLGVCFERYCLIYRRWYIDEY